MKTSPAQTAWVDRLNLASFAGLWLFAAVTLLSIAAQNILFVGMAAFVAAALLGRRGARLAPPAGLALPLALFLGWTLAAAFLSDNAAHSVVTWRRWLLVAAAWYAGCAVDTRQRLESILKALLLFSALWCLGASLIAVAKPAMAWHGGMPAREVLAQWVGRGEWRAVSGSGGYMVLGTGSMLALLLFASLALADRAWRGPLQLAAMACLALALVLTQTRSSWLGALAGLALLVVWRRPKAALLAALAAVALAAALWPTPLGLRVRQGFDMRQESTRERVYMAEAGVNIIRRYPLFGVGDALESFSRTRPDGAIESVMGQYRINMPDEAKADPVLRSREQGHLHNNFIMLAVMGGLPALALMLWLFGALGAHALSAARGADPLAAALGAGWLAAALGWWVNGLFEFNFASSQSSFTFWFLTGLMLAAARLAVPARTPHEA